MENILGQIYCWFQSFFGENLSYYLWGYDPSTEAFTNPNLYNTIGLVTIIVSLILVILFYYIINHPQSKWWSWLITLGGNSIIALFIGYGIVKSKYVNGYIPDNLINQRDEYGNNILVLIGDSNCWGFGIANMFVALICFIVFTLLLKWRSSSSKYIPF